MPKRIASKAVERSCFLYLRLLMFYPKSHRKEYGAAMLQLFRDQCRCAQAERRAWGLISFWLRTLVDLLKTLVLEHLSNLNRRKPMLKLFRPQFTPLPVFFKVFSAVFLLAFLTSVVIAFLIPESFRSAAQIAIGSVQPGLRALNSGIDPYVLQNEFEIIQSHAVLSKVIKSLDLCDEWGEKYNHGVSLTSDRAETILRRDLELHAYPAIKLVEVAAFSDDPDEAAKLANGVVDAYRDYKAEEARASNEAVPMRRTVSIIQPAVPEMHVARPNKPWIVTLGVAAGIMFGLIAGGVAAGFVERPNGNANSAGASRETPLDSRGSLPEKRRTNLAVWVVGSLWVSLAVPFTVLILIALCVSLFEISDGGRCANALQLVLSGFGGALISLAGISLLRGKLWARICIGIAAVALLLLLSSSNPLYLPFLSGPSRWVIVGFGVLTVGALLMSPRRGGFVLKWKYQP